MSLLFPLQLVVGSAATSPMQVIVDYTAHKSTHYTGGIFWIQGHSSDHIVACVQHINEVSFYLNNIVSNQ